MDWEDAKEHHMGVFPVHCFPAHLAVPSDLVFLLLHVPATNSHLLSACAVAKDNKFMTVSHYCSCDIFITNPSVLTGLVTSFTAYFYFEHWRMILH